MNYDNSHEMMRILESIVQNDPELQTEEFCPYSINEGEMTIYDKCDQVKAMIATEVDPKDAEVIKQLFVDAFYSSISTKGIEARKGLEEYGKKYPEVIDVAFDVLDERHNKAAKDLTDDPGLRAESEPVMKEVSEDNYEGGYGEPRDDNRLDPETIKIGKQQSWAEDSNRLINRIADAILTLKDNDKRNFIKEILHSFVMVKNTEDVVNFINMTRKAVQPYHSNELNSALIDFENVVKDSRTGRELFKEKEEDISKPEEQI